MHQPIHLYIYPSASLPVHLGPFWLRREATRVERSARCRREASEGPRRLQASGLQFSEKKKRREKKRARIDHRVGACHFKKAVHAYLHSI